MICNIHTNCHLKFFIYLDKYGTFCAKIQRNKIKHIKNCNLSKLIIIKNYQNFNDLDEKDYSILKSNQMKYIS